MQKAEGIVRSQPRLSGYRSSLAWRILNFAQNLSWEVLVFVFRSERLNWKRRALVFLLVALGTVSATSMRPGDAVGATKPRAADAPQHAYAAAAGRPLSYWIRRGRSKLNAATRAFGRGEYTKALASLGALRYCVYRAHRAGMYQIGRPPADPESDEPPGPPAVIAVLNLEHLVTMRITPLFNGRTNSRIINPLRYTLYKTHVRRDRMLNRVIRLNPNGAGADYDDSMADTLGIYTAEVNLITRALEEYRLTTLSHDGLSAALARVRATRAKVNRRWGGGE
jgi:hypothetical protein